MMTLDEALAQPGRRVAAWDHGGDGNTLLIVSVAEDDAKVISRETVAAERRSTIERQLMQHGIPIGSTDRSCGFIWVCTEAHLAVVRLGAGTSLEASGADLVIASRRVERRDVAAVQCFYNDDVTHRGVCVWLANGDAFTIAEQHDPIDPTRNLDFFLLGVDWIFSLGQDLAVRLGVQLQDSTWKGVVRAPALQRPADAATDVLFDGLVDAYVRWDDPDRVARRAAREAAEQKRDAAILDQAYIESGQRGDAPMDVAVAKMAAHFAGRVEREVPDDRTFEVIHQPLPEIENGGYIALDLKPAASGGRVLELRVESPSGEHTANEVLCSGSTAELVRHLRAPEFPDQLLPIMRRLTDVTNGNPPSSPEKPAPASVSKVPRARTSAEMRFYASLQKCAQCDSAVDPAWLKIYGDGTAWTYAGKCACCQCNLGYTFLTVDDDPIHAPRALHELGCGHSQIISPRMFAAEIARLEPMLITDPTGLALKKWQAHRDSSIRFDTCISELAKFIPDGASTIPDAVLSADDRVDREAHPERYTREWVDRVRAHAERVSTGIIADLTRIDSLMRIADKRRPKGIDYIEREALQAHERWIERGRKGKGRLIVVDARHEAMKIGRGVNLSGARFFDTELPDVYLMDVRFHDAELVDTCLVRGKLYGAEFVGTTLTAGSLAAADLETADLSQTTINGTDFTDAELHLTAWDKAVVSHANFTRAQFGDANLDGAVFKDCEFRDAAFSAEDQDTPPTTKARFERCDLRGATWDGRDLAGAKFIDCEGAPTAL